MTGITIEAFSGSRHSGDRPHIAQWVKQHLSFAYAFLFVAGIMCGTSITLGLRMALPRVIQAIDHSRTTAAGIDLNDPVYDLKKTPSAVWHIPAPLEVDIERAKRELDAALHEPRK